MYFVKRELSELRKIPILHFTQKERKKKIENLKKIYLDTYRTIEPFMNFYVKVQNTQNESLYYYSIMLLESLSKHFQLSEELMWYKIEKLGGFSFYILPDTE